MRWGFVYIVEFYRYERDIVAFHQTTNFYFKANRRKTTTEIGCRLVIKKLCEHFLKLLC